MSGWMKFMATERIPTFLIYALFFFFDYVELAQIDADPRVHVRQAVKASKNEGMFKKPQIQHWSA